MGQLFSRTIFFFSAGPGSEIIGALEQTKNLHSSWKDVGAGERVGTSMPRSGGRTMFGILKPTPKSSYRNWRCAVRMRIFLAAERIAVRLRIAEDDPRDLGPELLVGYFYNLIKW